MKKQITIILIIIALIIGIFPIYSNADNVGVTLNTSVNVVSDDDGKSAEIVLSLGNFNGLAENSPLGYQTEIEYDSSIFESVKAEGLNGWTVTYEPSASSTIVGDIGATKPNTEITKITAKLKNGLSAGTKGDIKLNNLKLTDGENQSVFNKTFTISYDGTTTKADVTDNGSGSDNDNTNTEKNTSDSASNNANTTGNVNSSNTANTSNTNSSRNSTNNSVPGVSTNTANTSKITRLPAAGINRVLFITVVVIAILAIIFKIKSRKIKY